MTNILILKFPYSSLYGGGERHTMMLVEALSRQGFKFYLASSCQVLLWEFKKRSFPYQKVWLVPEPVAVWSLLIFFLLWPYACLRLFILFLNYYLKKKCRVIYCLSLTEKVLLTPWAKLFGCQVIWMEHVNFGDWLKKSPLRILYRFFSRWAKIIYVSKAIEKDLLNLGIKKDYLRLIYSGIDFQRCKTPESDNVLRYPKKFVIGTICRLEKEKGVEFLLKAIKIAAGVISNIQLVVIGEGSEKRNLLWLASQLGIKERVHFAGFQEDIFRWLPGFDIFVLPSYKRESFGLILAEAMACQIPCVATRIGGIPEVAVDGQTGYLVEPGSAQAIADRIIELYYHPHLRQAMGKNGRERVKKYFAQERMIKEFVEELTIKNPHLRRV